MVSIWWIIWAFVIGGYAGMLLVSLLVLARKVKPTGRNLVGTWLGLDWDLVGIKHCAQGCPCPRMGVSNFPRLGQIVKGISSRSGTRPAEGLGGSSA
jgi:hypothetical protein